MKILEIYEKKIKVSIEGVIQWITPEELDLIIKKHDEKINRAKLQMQMYEKYYDEHIKKLINLKANNKIEYEQKLKEFSPEKIQKKFYKIFKNML